MSERNPAIDPQPGDELAGNPWRYLVVWNEIDRVTYELYSKDWGYVAAHSVSLAGWRDMAVGLTVEKVA